MSYTSTGGLASLPRLAVAGVDQGAPESGLAGGLGGAASANTLTLPTQASAPAAPATGVVLYANSSGRLSWRRASDGFSRSIVVTATADRVFTMPDASITVAGQNFANTFSVLQVFSANGALSAPAVSFTGTPGTGGTATTTKPMVLVETAGATSTGWVTGGVMFGVNAPSGFAGWLASFQLNGTEYARISSSGIRSINSAVQADGGLFLGASADAIISRKTTANLQLGAADAAAPVAQTLSVQSVVAGTTDTAGANWTYNASRGTGTGYGGTHIFQVAPAAGSTASTQNALVAAFRIETSAAYGTGGVGVRIGSGSSPYLWPFSGTASSTSVTAGTGLAFYSAQSATADEHSFAFTGASRTATSGVAVDVRLVRTFNPTSGTSAYAQLQVNPTINQTGGANGVTRAIYINPTLTSAADFRALEITDGNVVLPKTVTAGGTTGAQTINKLTGSVNFAAAATSLVVTNAYVTTSSIIIATVATNDTTMKSVAVVAAAGSFTLHANAAATAETRVNFIVIN